MTSPVPYDKTLVGDDGEEFPYTESLTDGTYHYRISVIWRGRDGELQMSEWGAHVAFDDDGSWMRFDVPPNVLFPGQDRLSEADLLNYLGFIATRADHAQTLSAEEVEAWYQRFLRETGFNPEDER